MTHIVKKGRKIQGFVKQDAKGDFWYSFGKPSQYEYIAFACNSLEQGIARIQMHSNICELKTF